MGLFTRDPVPASRDVPLELEHAVPSSSAAPPGVPHYDGRVPPPGEPPHTRHDYQPAPVSAAASRPPAAQSAALAVADRRCRHRAVRRAGRLSRDHRALVQVAAADRGAVDHADRRRRHADRAARCDHRRAGGRLHPAGQRHQCLHRDRGPQFPIALGHFAARHRPRHVPQCDEQRPRSGREHDHAATCQERVPRFQSHLPPASCARC